MAVSGVHRGACVRNLVAAMTEHNCLIRAYVDTLRELRKLRDRARVFHASASEVNSLSREIATIEDLMRQLLPLEYKEF